MRRLAALLLCELLAWSAQAAIALQYKNKLTQSGAATSIQLAFGSTPNQNSTIIVALVVSGASTAISSVVDDQSNSYTQRVVGTFQSGVGHCELWTAKATNVAASPIITASFSVSATNAVIQIANFTGVDQTSPFDTGASNQSSTGTSITSNNVNTSLANEVLIGFSSFSPASTVTPGSGYTSIDTTAASFGTQFAYRVVSSTGSYDWNGTLSTSGAWTACLATLKDASQPSGSIRHRTMMIQ